MLIDDLHLIKVQKHIKHVGPGLKPHGLDSESPPCPTYYESLGNIAWPLFVSVSSSAQWGGKEERMGDL